MATKHEGQWALGFYYPETGTSRLGASQTWETKNQDVRPAGENQDPQS